MAQQIDQAPKALPPWVVRVGSVVIILHFLAVGSLVLSASSGPWWVPQFSRESPAMGPKFVEKINEFMAINYLEPLRLGHNYHFTSNRLGKISAVYFEANLMDGRGVVIKKVKFPDAADNFWLGHRYKLLALGLGNDQPVQTSGGEVIQAPGKKMATVNYWDTSDSKLWKLKSKDVNQIPRDRPVMQPSELSQHWALAFQRYLLREYGASSVELIRHSKEPVLPDFMYMNPPPPNAFDELVCSFGVYPLEK